MSNIFFADISKIYRSSVVFPLNKDYLDNHHIFEVTPVGFMKGINLPFKGIETGGISGLGNVSKIVVGN